jgi:outer membrane immunogenic protein
MKPLLKAIGIALGALALGALVIITAIGIGTSASKAKSLTGCYGGAAIGIGVTNATTGLDTPLGNVLTIDGLGSQGAVSSAFGGCDVQFDRVVVGAWGDFGWHDQTITITANPASTEGHVDLKSSWAVGGRAGYMFSPDYLAYALAGYTRASFGDMSASSGGGPLGSVAVPDLTGWMVGGGVEMALPITGLYLDARYTFSRYEKASLALGKTGASIGFEPDVHQARIGLLYRFDASAFPKQ